MNKEQIKYYVQNRLIKEFGDIKSDFDKFDFDAYIDESLTNEENYTEIQAYFNSLYSKKLQETADKEKALEAEQAYREESHNNEGLFKTQANYLIVGKKGSAKTCYGFSCMAAIHRIQQKRCYIYRFPQPEQLKKIPFKVSNVVNLMQLYSLTDAVVLIDEAHIHFSSAEKTVNEDLRNLLSISRQNNVDFIFICHNSYFLNRSLFSFIDVRIIKEVSPGHWDLERTYMKRLYSHVQVFGKANFFIDCDFIRENSSFSKPEWFTDELSNAYNTKEQKEDFFSKLLRRYAGNGEHLRTNATEKKQ